MTCRLEHGGHGAWVENPLRGEATQLLRCVFTRELRPIGAVVLRGLVGPGGDGASLLPLTWN